jgi:diadenosine tetraphosphate (Ap4A) HIT family hydrolase
MEFHLHQQLEAETVKLGAFALCDALLMKDANYPWVILVPRRAKVTEIFHLNESDQGLLIKESTFVAATMHALFAADKMNVAALGNIVPQLHLHHIVRRTTDQAWPQPVWGRVGRLDYDAETLATMVVKLRAAFRLP